MKLLFQYLKKYKSLIALALLLAAINQLFSLMDPLVFRHIVDKYATHHKDFTKDEFIKGVGLLILLSMGFAMVSRIAKNFQDYYVNVITQKLGAKIYSDGLKHSLELPYQVFEDQRSGETLSILTKVRGDVEKFMNYCINLLFGILVGIGFVFVYAALYISWYIPLVYLGGIFLLTIITNLLSKKIKIIQKIIVGQTTALAGTTTESLRNIELIKSLGLTTQEVGRLNRNTYKILGLELTKVKRIRSISFVQGTFVNTLH